MFIWTTSVDVEGHESKMSAEDLLTVNLHNKIITHMMLRPFSEHEHVKTYKIMKRAQVGEFMLM